MKCVWQPVSPRERLRHCRMTLRLSAEFNGMGVVQILSYGDGVRLYAVRFDVVQLGVVQIVSYGMSVRLQWFNRVSCKL